MFPVYVWTSNIYGQEECFIPPLKVWLLHEDHSCLLMKYMKVGLPQEDPYRLLRRYMNVGLPHKDPFHLLRQCMMFRLPQEYSFYLLRKNMKGGLPHEDLYLLLRKYMKVGPPQEYSCLLLRKYMSDGFTRKILHIFIGNMKRLYMGGITLYKCLIWGTKSLIRQVHLNTSPEGLRLSLYMLI